MDKLFGNPSIDFLARAMDARALQLKLTANNIANVNTPGFKATLLTYKEQMQRVLRDAQDQLPLKHTLAPHIRKGMPYTIDDVKLNMISDPTTSMRSDGNNVDIDQQMASMAQNSMEINAVTRMLSDKMRGLRMVIEGR